jgi:hypothetical protein
MARKKRAVGHDKESPDPVPAPAEAGTAEAPPSPLDLAVPVSEVVQILSVALRGGSIESESEIFTHRDEYQIRIAIDGVEHRLDAETNTLGVTVSFVLLAGRHDDDAGSPGLAIRASFALDYELPPSAGFEEPQLRAFAMTNGVYNAWPYWREYVQSTTTRMGLPPIIVPVFRL